MDTTTAGNEENQQTRLPMVKMDLDRMFRWEKTLGQLGRGSQTSAKADMRRKDKLAKRSWSVKR